MKIVDEALMDAFRRKPACEWCGAKNTVGLDPHHIRGRGHGAMRVDKAINLVAICRVCHTAAHYEGRPGYDDLIALVAKREGRTVDDIEREIAADRRRTRK